MTRSEFTRRLSSALGSIPQNERGEILNDYFEHFEAELKKGKTEEEICASLGNPEEIARSYIDESTPSQGYNDGYSNSKNYENNGVNTNAASTGEIVLWTIASMFFVLIAGGFFLCMFFGGIGIVFGSFTVSWISFTVTEFSSGFVNIGIGAIFLMIFGACLSVISIWCCAKLFPTYFRFISSRISGKKLPKQKKKSKVFIIVILILLVVSLLTAMILISTGVTALIHDNIFEFLVDLVHDFIERHAPDALIYWEVHIFPYISDSVCSLPDALPSLI